MDANEKHAEEGSESCTDGNAKSLTLDVPKPPSIEDFIILKPISRGAFGKVYLARKKCNGRLYAVKVMKKADMVDKNMTGQMKAERNALALSKSPFVVHLFYSLQTAKKIYLVMEYLIGGDVKSLLHIYGYFDQDMAVKYISEVALALDYLHRHGIIHRDLKPDNMLVSNKGHIKLTDFGLSKVKLDRELSLADILTTPSLAKPKQDYFRTPGQVLSLISSLGFSTPATESKRHCSASAVFTPMSCGKIGRRKSSLCSPLRKKESLVSLGCSSRALGPNSCVFSPYTLAKNLTPSLLKSRKRFETLSAASSHFPSTTDSEGGISPLWENEQKENEQIHEEKMSEQVLSCEIRAETVTSKPRMPGWDRALKSLDNFEFPAKASRGRSDATPGEMRKKTKPDTLAGKRLQFNKEEPSASTKEFSPLLTDGSRNVIASSVKRAFSDIDRSPEPLEIQAKKSDAEYKRCFEIPEESVGLHTGLTGVFSTVHLEDFGPSTKGSGLAEEDQVPRPSSPSAVTKNLLCELEEPTEDVFVDNVRELANLSFASGEDHELTRSLSFDSEGSMHEMSIVVNSPASQKPGQCSKRNSTSLEEMENKNVATTGSLPHTPTAANIETPKLGNAFQRGESKSSVLDRLPELACSVTKSPSFLKPRNVVVFRSYCSAIDRSNVSWNSHLSLGSVEAMDMSTSASYHSLAAAITPVQKTPASNSSLYQTPQSMATSHTPFRTPKSVRRGAVPVEGAPILGTPDYLAPELLLGKSHDFRVDWWALGVCLFEFLTGVPPFNDETPQLVFQNILNRDIPWPGGEEELSDSSRKAIEILLAMDMTKRAGLKELRCHPLFEGLDWDNLQDQPMPFIPQPEDETDTSYFDARNNAQQLAVSDFSL